jgi:hypothetical protein
MSYCGVCCCFRILLSNIIPIMFLVFISLLWSLLRFQHNQKRFSVHSCLQLFARGNMSYLRYLCLFVYSGIQHILPFCRFCSRSNANGVTRGVGTACYSGALEITAIISGVIVCHFDQFHILIFCYTCCDVLYNFIV